MGKLMTGSIALMCLFTMVWIAVAGGTRSTSKPRPRSFMVHPIGTVFRHGARTTIKIDTEYQDGLVGLEKFSHVWVFYWFDQNDTPLKRKTLQVHPKGDRNLPLTGVFATRSPVRPNLIALTLCKILAIKGNVLEVDKIDAFDGTPVIDLKPYIPAFDRVGVARTPAWVPTR